MAKLSRREHLKAVERRLAEHTFALGEMGVEKVQIGKKVVKVLKSRPKRARRR